MSSLCILIIWDGGEGGGESCKDTFLAESFVVVVSILNGEGSCIM